MASAEVRTEVTDSALVEMMNQLRRIREEPVSTAELEAAKSYLTGSIPAAHRNRGADRRASRANGTARTADGQR